MKYRYIYYFFLYSVHLLGQVESPADTIDWYEEAADTLDWSHPVSMEDSIKKKQIEQNFIYGKSFEEYFSFSIRRCNDTTSRNSCYCEYKTFYGSVKDGIQKVLNIRPDRLYFKGSVPNSKICFDDFPQQSGVNFKNLFFKTMHDYLGLKRVYQDHVMCEFWIVEKTKRMKFPIYDALRDGPNTYARMDAKTNEYISTGGPLQMIAQGISMMTQKTVENHIANDRLVYNFKIPNAAFESFESLAKYLIDTYGVLLRKEKRVAPVTIVEFQE
jgi:hypothetical protein